MKLMLKKAAVLAMMALPLCAVAQKDAIDQSYFNKAVPAGTDFYQHAVGGWMNNNPVPPTESRWGSFNEIAERNKKILRGIMEDSGKSKNAMGSARQKIGDFYKIGMDSVRLNKDGFAPLKPYFDKIAKIKNKQGVLDFVAMLQNMGLGTIYSFYVYQDQMNSSVIVPYFGQGGLSLPDKDYYLKNDPDKTKLREALVAHISKVFTMIGDSQEKADKAANAILALETRLAGVSMDRTAMRDPYATYHKMTLGDLGKLTPNVNWTSHTAKYGLPKIDSVVVSQPDFFKGLDMVIAEESLDTWKTYLRWQMIGGSTLGMLGDSFSQEGFNFSKVSSGAKKRKDRWERVLQTVDGNLGELLGQIYVDQAFKPEAKDRMLKMVRNLQGVFSERIKNLDWMSAETKEKAQYKLSKFIVKIGYPDKWRDYSALNIKPTDSYMEANFKVTAFEYKYMMSKLGKPVDKTEWGMTPQTVNAYYNPSVNEIVFPAAILQPPFFDFDADDALNYGAIGAVIGHEMTHGFDDEGRQYDADGNLKDWWTKADAEKFTAKADIIVDQFNNFKLYDTLSVNGKLTLGENLADHGGLAIAYDAFKRTEQGKNNTTIGGMTADQRFFWSWANAWKNNSTPQRAKQLLVTDPHSPPQFRANGPIKHMQQWYDAFGIKPADAMFRKEEQRVKIW